MDGKARIGINSGIRFSTGKTGWVSTVLYVYSISGMKEQRHNDDVSKIFPQNAHECFL